MQTGDNLNASLVLSFPKFYIPTMFKSQPTIRWDDCANLHQTGLNSSNPGIVLPQIHHNEACTIATVSYYVITKAPRLRQ